LNSTGSRRRKVTPRPSGVETVAESSRDSTNHCACRDGTLRCGTRACAGSGVRRLCSTLRARPFTMVAFVVGGSGNAWAASASSSDSGTCVAESSGRPSSYSARFARICPSTVGSVGNRASGPARKSRSAISCSAIAEYSISMRCRSERFTVSTSSARGLSGPCSAAATYRLR
jgi:hypothetical protein